MAYEVFARKWRPKIFQDVIGQKHITQTLINAIKMDRLAHAYLFSGARGVGKTSVARILARAVNCPERNEGNPCNMCSSCLEITGGSSVDVQEIDGASNRGIDEIRELRENIKYMPSSSRFRVYIIDEVHMLTLPAFNALLKTLEEPPPHVKFIFATTEPHKVPITILSRCQLFDFKRIPQGRIVELLEKIIDHEGIEISNSGLNVIAREAEGSMRDAESLLDQVTSQGGSKVDDREIIDILGIIDRELIFEASGAIIEGLPGDCIEIVDRVYNFGYDLKEFYRALMDQFRNLIISLVAPNHELIDMTEQDREQLKIQAEKAGLENLQQSLNILIGREEALRYSSHPRLILETIMIKMCQLGELLSFGDLLSRFEVLEKKLAASSGSFNTLSTGNISEPEISWEEEDSKSGFQEISEELHWDDVLKYLSTRNKAMSNVLGEWSLKSFAGGTMEIFRGKSPFSSVYLDDPERMEKLLGYLRDFFKREINIKIQGTPVNIKDSGVMPSGGGTGATDQKNPELPRPVQDVIRIFKGEIKEEISKGQN